MEGIDHLPRGICHVSSQVESKNSGVDWANQEQTLKAKKHGILCFPQGASERSAEDRWHLSRQTGACSGITSSSSTHTKGQTSRLVPVPRRKNSSSTAPLNFAQGTLEDGRFGGGERGKGKGDRGTEMDSTPCPPSDQIVPARQRHVFMLCLGAASLPHCHAPHPAFLRWVWQHQQQLLNLHPRA